MVFSLLTDGEEVTMPPGNGEVETSLNKESEKEINIYPNPAKDIIYYVLSDLNGANAIEIYSYLGQLVHKQTLNDIKGSIDISQLRSGLYIIKANGAIPLIKQFIIE